MILLFWDIDSYMQQPMRKGHSSIVQKWKKLLSDSLLSEAILLPFLFPRECFDVYFEFVASVKHFALGRMTQHFLEM